MSDHEQLLKIKALLNEIEKRSVKADSIKSHDRLKANWKAISKARVDIAKMVIGRKLTEEEQELVGGQY